ncbi:cellulase family glycosylhydrolase [Candidatus Bipolaricaulota bacterium]|nr:cellulase family glycosylhydrolase [Candidatus Bipolaricaulota bacterium]
MKDQNSDKISDKISRRDFLKATVAGFSAFVSPTIINYLGKSSPSSDKEFLEIRNGNFYMGGEEYTIKGANYQTRDYPWRMFKAYDPQQIDKELGIAENFGINTVRVAFNYPYSTGQSKPYEKPVEDTEIDEQYFENFRDFLGIADSHGIKVISIALNTILWEFFDPKYHHLGNEYLENWLPEFADDERILVWDVKNEPEITQATFRREGKGGKYDVEAFTKKMSDKIKKLDPNHPVTIGLSDTIDTCPEGANTPQSTFRKRVIESLSDYIDHEDFYSFHYYTHLKYFKTAVDKIKEQTDKPIVLQEFGLPTTGEKWKGEDDQEWYYNEMLERVNRADLNGVMFWELNDHPEKLGKLDIPWGAVYDNPVQNDFADDFGILRTDYSKKPAAHVVQQYYKQIL